MKEQEHLAIWQGTMSVAALGEMLRHAGRVALLGQRPGGYTLGRSPGSLQGAASEWPSGRCFNEDYEIRWWPADDGEERSVLVLNRLPDGWTPPDGWKRLEPVAAREDVRYLCVGEYDRAAPKGVHRWWETRYARSFEYLDSAPPAGGGGDAGGRVYLRTVRYELSDGRVQHRLVRFEHARQAGEAAS